MKQTSTPTSDSTETATSVETLHINKSNLSKEEYDLLLKLAKKSISNFKPIVPDRGSCVYTYSTYDDSIYKMGFNGKMCEFRNAHGLIFPTEEAAQAYREKFLILSELNYLSACSAEPYKAWDGETKHYCIVLDTTSDKVHVVFNETCVGFAPYFPSREAALEAIEKIGEEKLKWALLLK